MLTVLLATLTKGLAASADVADMCALAYGDKPARRHGGGGGRFMG
jgi:hypothetical protein